MRIAFTIALFLVASPAMAIEYCVDADNGSNGNNGLYNGGVGPSCWADPWYADDQLSSGDTVYVYAVDGGGHYYNGGSSVFDTLDANTIWVNVPGESPRISITSAWGDNNWVGGGKAVASFSAANTTIDGLTFWGQVVATGSADGSILKNSYFLVLQCRSWGL